jgi:hypothetical protein
MSGASEYLEQTISRLEEHLRDDLDFSTLRNVLQNITT